MNILIVDDSSIKVNRLVSIIDQYHYDNKTIQIAENIADAMSVLRTSKIDLMVLDLNLPNRQGEVPKADGGIRFLQEIIRRQTLNRPGYIIGLTEYKEIKDVHEKIFNKEGWVLCSYDPKLTDWEDTIINKLSYIENKAIQNKKNEKVHTGIVIFSALAKEFVQLRQFLTDVRMEIHEETGTIYEVGTFLSQEVVLIETGVGNVKAAIEAERALSKFQPEVALFVGIGGGIKDVQIGDVVFATKVYWIEAGKDEEKFRARPGFGESNYQLEQLARFQCRNEKWLEEKNLIFSKLNTFSDTVRCYCGPIAASEKVIVSSLSASYQNIKDHANDAIVVAMEEYGFLHACRAHSVRPLVIRGISDTIDNKTEADKHGSQEFATFTASTIAFDFIELLLATSNPKKN